MAYQIPLLTGVLVTGAGTGVPIPHAPASFQAVVTGTGAVTAVIACQVSNDGINWLTAGTISLSGTTTATDGFPMTAPWLYVRGNITSISGTSAAVTLTMGG
jgi:hypothetical protein